MPQWYSDPFVDSKIFIAYGDGFYRSPELCVSRMSTAIVTVCTYQGFVVAADGLRLKSNGEPHSEKQKKIVSIHNEKESIGIGISGYSGDNFDVYKLCENALIELSRYSLLLPGVST